MTKIEAAKLRKKIRDREERLRQISGIMRAHRIRITVKSGTRYVLDELIGLSNLRKPLFKEKTR